MKLAALLLTATAQLAFAVSTPVSISTPSDERDMAAFGNTVEHERMARAPVMELVAVDEFGKATPFAFSAACVSNVTTNKLALLTLYFRLPVLQALQNPWVTRVTQLYEDLLQAPCGELFKCT
jgi:hypothetical protein